MKKNTRILVVDDDKYILDGLSELFTRDGYFIDTSPSGEDALEKVSNNIYNLAIADIKMPGIDGLELLREIKKLKPNLNVILMTAYATVNTAIEAMKYGASDFVTKPFKMEDFLRIVKINALSFGVYVDDKEIADNETRNMIYDFISTNPGEHYRGIQSKLLLGNGVLNYHLHLLEKKDLIKVKRNGVYKRYYPRFVKAQEGRKQKLSEIQETIIRMVEDNQGISQQELSKLLGISRQSINYHIKKLVRRDILRIIKEGNRSKIWIAR